ncbi:hypothetical protein HPB48_012994 [Haemaphysalis longicornis]|uniref:THAP-type domain-containing protein n=1 Tax=Haemaphysalis longicornis TaxID=44386 RepID=A0A9J6GX21_HAELO|nr:hypothetical protein HPB48_012994 [Haemaphysalis longicornis]
MNVLTFSDCSAQVPHGLLLCSVLPVGFKKQAAGISFHEIPADEALRQQWIKAIRRDDLGAKHQLQLLWSVQ